MKKVYVLKVGKNPTEVETNELNSFLEELFGEELNVDENEDLNIVGEQEELSLDEEFIKSLNQETVDYIYDLSDKLKEMGITRSPSKEELLDKWYDSLCAKLGFMVNKKSVIALKEKGYSDDEIYEVFNVIFEPEK